MTVCAIHQPNFFPWLPYFDKIAMADVFIFLDAVHYPKSGKSMGSWCNRVKVSMHGQSTWISCPVIRESGPQLINKVMINKSSLDSEKLLYTLKCAYAKKVSYNKINEIVTSFFFNEIYDSLADFNIHVIKKISELLGLRTKFIRQSELRPTQLFSNEMLVDLCDQVKAKTYLCGLGAKDYMIDKVFSDWGVNVEYQNTNYLYEGTNFSILHYLIEHSDEDWNQFNAKK